MEGNGLIPTNVIPAQAGIQPSPNAKTVDLGPQRP